MSLSLNMLKNATIRTQINTIILVAISGFAITGFLYNSSYKANLKKEADRNFLTSAKKLNDDIAYNFLNARRNEKDFLLRLDDKSIKDHTTSSQIINFKASELRNLLTKHGHESQEIEAIEQSYDKYKGQFDTVVKYWQQIGLNENSGLQGDFYKAAAALEKDINTINDDVLKILYLQMRNNEKDYMRFLEYDFIEAVENQASVVSKRLKLLEAPPALKDSATKNLDTYLEKFLKMSDLRDNIVVQTKKLSTTFAEAKPLLDEFSENLAEEADQAILLAKSSTLKSFNLMLTVIISTSILVLALSYIIGRNISRPIHILSLAMKDLASGNLELNVPFLKQTNEAGIMAKALQIFKESAIETENMRQEQKLQELRAEAEKRQMMYNLAERFNNQVSDLLTLLTSASIELQSTAENMKMITDETAHASASVASTTHEASANVSTVAAAMEEMSASSNEIAAQVLSAKVKSNDTAHNAQNANKTVGNLNTLVNGIGEVVVAIKDIAEQTNLLALNATIEAARAGEAGKGFAVVADEVKKLANETAQKTNEIGARIAEVQNATKNSVDVMERIIGNISEIDQSVTSVSAAVEQQNATTGEITRSISEASHGVEEVARIISDVQAAASEAGSSADIVYTASKDVSKLSDNLKNSIEQFINQIKIDNTAEAQEA